MPFARHETFYIRDGWLRKGLKIVKERGFNFFKNKNAAEVLGMGKNMVQALRFWLIASRLLEESGGGVKKSYKLSDFAEMVLDNDPYFEDEGTLWLLHYNLATNKDHPTTWYWFFNIFNHKEFDEMTFLFWLENYTVTEGYRIALSSLKKDFQCFINTYLYEKRLNKNNSPEDNLNCPLRELRLLSKTGPKAYKLNYVNRQSLDPTIVFYVIKRWQEDNNMLLHITISNIIDEECNAGKVFNLSNDDIIYYLEKLRGLGLVTISRTAGLDRVDLKDISSARVLKNILGEARQR